MRQNVASNHILSYLCPSNSSKTHNTIGTYILIKVYYHDMYKHIFHFSIFLLKASFTTFLLTFSGMRLYAQQCLFYDSGYLGCTLISSLAQDADGLMWIGTEQGLWRFDGYSFNPVTLPQSDGVSNDIGPLMTDHEGRLWVATALGLMLYDRNTDQLLPVHFPNDLHPRVTSQLQLSDGRLLAGTAGYGLFLVNPDSLVATPLNGYAPENDAAYWVSLYQSRDGSVWKSNPDGIVCRRQANGTIQQWETGHGQARDFVEWKGHVIPVCQNGLQLGGNDVALPFTCAVRDGQTLYFGTRAAGLQRLTPNSRNMERIDVPVLGLDLNQARISTLFIDRNGNLWVGCYGRGLLVVPLKRQPLFQTWSLASQGHETGTYVTSIVEGDNGQTWCVVSGNGIYAFDRDGRISAHPQSPLGAETLFRDASGDYYLGTATALYRYQPQTGNAVRLPIEIESYINAMADAGQDKLAVSVFGNGMLIVDKKTGRLIRRETMNDTDTLRRGRLCNNWIYAMAPDNRGRLWLGTSSGICCYNTQNASYAAEPLTGRPEGATLAVQERVLHDGKACTALSTHFKERPLFSCELAAPASVSFMTHDHCGDVWVSTAAGLFHLTSGDSVFTAPLLRDEFVRGAGLQTSDGHILLGMADGIVRFHPDSVRRHLQGSARVHLTAFVLAGQSATPQTRSGRSRIMDMPVSDCHNFRLAYTDASFRLEFSLLDFADVRATAFEYRLQGDEHWQQVGHGQNTIVFNHLAPGTYQLEVRALEAGTYTPIETYILEVRPPWWRSPLAFFVYLLLVAITLLLAAVAYRHHLRHEADKEKLHFLLSAISSEDTPLTLPDMRRAIATFVQSRKRQRDLYGNSAAVADRLETPEVRGNDDALMDRIVQSINHHLQDSDFGVEQLCVEAAISRAHLHRKMKELTGLSTSEFIRNIRLEQATRLLREQKLNITQVAYSVGFSNVGYFSTAFRKHFGLSPREFQEQEGKGTLNVEH